MNSRALYVMKAEIHDEGSFAYIGAFESLEEAAAYIQDTHPHAVSWETLPAQEYILDDIYELCTC